MPPVSRKPRRAEKRSVPPVRSSLATEARGAEGQDIPDAGRIAHAGAEEAVARIVASSLALKEGFRLLVLGNSRKGKSTFMNFLNSEIAPETDGIFIHDAKYRVPQYRHDVVRASLADLEDEDRGRVVEIFARPMVTSPNDVARACCDFGLQGMQTVCEIDEMRSAMKGRAFDGGEDCPLAFLLTQGGGMGASFVGLAQIPQNVPVTVLTCCQWIALFQTESAALRYIERDCALPDAAIAACETLEPGQFLLYERGGGDWDHTVYTVPREFVVNR